MVKQLKPPARVVVPSASILRCFTPKQFDQLYAALVATEDALEINLDDRGWRTRPSALSLENHEIHKDLTDQLHQAKLDNFCMNRIYYDAPWPRWWRVHRGSLHATIACHSIDRRRQSVFLDSNLVAYRWTRLSLAVEFSGLSRAEVLATPPDSPSGRANRICKICGHREP